MIIYIGQNWKMLIILVVIYLLKMKLQFTGSSNHSITFNMPTSKLPTFTDIAGGYLNIYDGDKKNNDRYTSKSVWYLV